MSTSTIGPSRKSAIVAIAIACKPRDASDHASVRRSRGPTMRTTAARIRSAISRRIELPAAAAGTSNSPSDLVGDARTEKGLRRRSKYRWRDVEAHSDDEHECAARKESGSASARTIERVRGCAMLRGSQPPARGRRRSVQGCVQGQDGQWKEHVDHRDHDRTSVVEEAQRFARQAAACSVGSR